MSRNAMRNAVCYQYQKKKGRGRGRVCVGGMVTSRAAAPVKGEEWRMQEGSRDAFEGREEPAADDDTSDGDGCNLRAAAARALELITCASRTARVIDCTC